MKKLLAIIAFTSLSVQAAPALPPVVTTLMPVSIKPIMEITHELGRGVNPLGPRLSSQPSFGGGGVGGRPAANMSNTAESYANNVGKVATAVGVANATVKAMTGVDVASNVARSISRSAEARGTQASHQARANRGGR